MKNYLGYCLGNRLERLINDDYAIDYKAAFEILERYVPNKKLLEIAREHEDEKCSIIDRYEKSRKEMKVINKYLSRLKMINYINPKDNLTANEDKTRCLCLFTDYINNLAHMYDEKSLKEMEKFCNMGRYKRQFENNYMDLLSAKNISIQVLAISVLRTNEMRRL